MSGWETPLPEDLAVRARDTAREVATRLRDPARLRQAIRESPAQSSFADSVTWRSHELASGHPGLAILFAVCAAAFPDEDWDVAAQAHLEVAVEAVRERDLPPSLFQGLAGLSFAALILGSVGAFEEELQAQTKAAAEHLAASGAGVAVRDFDVVSGIAGIGASLLEHGDPVPVLGTLVHLARTDGAIPAWHTPPQLLDEYERDLYPSGYLNCGLAHGIPGPLALLSLAHQSGVRVDGAPEAIERIAAWIAGQILEDEWGLTWPAGVSLGPEKPEPARSAWCYGPPGVARSLWLAGEALSDSSYRDLALEAMAAVYRRPVAERRIDSPTFCHGVAGLLQITLRFAHDTGLPFFREAAAEVAGQLIDAYDPDSLLGYRDLEPGDRLVDRASLLSGAAGVALVLLAASSSVHPVWDRAFLLS